MKQLKVYISGPITGKENGNREAFKAAAEALLEKGLTPINPHDVGDGIQGKPDWLDFMKVDIRAMLDADAVFVLPGWRESRGSMVEVRLSEMLGFPLFDQFDDLIQYCETTARTAS